LSSSTFFWERSTTLLSILASIGSPSAGPSDRALEHAVAGEQPDEIVFCREIEAALAGVALTAGAAAQLVVDAAALVALGAEHVEAAGLERLRIQLNVHAAAGHVGGDGDGAVPAGVQDDGGLSLVLLGVEDVVRQALTLEQPAEQLADLYADVPTSTGCPSGSARRCRAPRPGNFSCFVLKT